jgi:hypothetical protein
MFGSPLEKRKGEFLEFLAFFLCVWFVRGREKKKVREICQHYPNGPNKIFFPNR